MQAPNLLTLWNETFTADATVVYVSEPCTTETVLEICIMIRTITVKNLWGASYFLVLFPNAASVLFFSPQKAICNGIATGDLPLTLAQARLRITETMLDLITQCTKANSK
jgi:hypothetical protein